MNKYHQEILEEIKKVSKGKIVSECNLKIDLGKYMGTSKPMYDLNNSKAREIAKNWVKLHKDISLEEFLDVLGSLYQGKSHTERTFGGFLLEYNPKLRKQIDPDVIKAWLTGAQGWLEVDSLCQSPFKSSEMLENWDKWEKVIKNLSQDKDVHKRRSSLVLLTGPTRQSSEKKLSDLAFENVEKLKLEKDVLITKAISWLLRSLITHHKGEVGEYVKANLENLPKIAIRETEKKLLTGKK
ncbi:MAG: DNA alkylation repair protein [Candidatus Daviesbacteria bacterium]